MVAAKADDRGRACPVICCIGISVPDCIAATAAAKAVRCRRDVVTIGPSDDADSRESFRGIRLHASCSMLANLRQTYSQTNTNIFANK